MTNLATYKVGACKFDYEYMGKSLSELASIYGFPEDVIEAECRHNGWERKLEPTAMPKTSDLQKFAEELEDITRTKLSIISLFRQIENQPLYAQIEEALLDKLLELVSDIETTDDKAAMKLGQIAKTLSSIQERNPINLADQLKDAIADGAGKVVVQIANNIQ